MRSSIDKVIFACVHNAGRSQMAAAFFARLVDPDKATAISAGTEPGQHVHPEVVQAMREVGVEIGDAKPQLLTPDLSSDATWLITMGCGESYPLIPGAQRADWALPDPKGQPIESVRTIRDDIEQRVRAFIAELHLGR